MKKSFFTSSALALVAALALSACGGTANSAGTPAGSASSGINANCPGGEIKFGIEPYEDPAKLTPAYDVLATALSKKLNCPVKVQVVEDYSAEVLAMRNGKLDLGEFGPLGFVFASQKAGAEPLVSFATSDKKLSSYSAGIWVAKDSPLKTIADLKGKSLALGSVGSTSGDVLPRFGLRGVGIADADLKMDYTGGHPEALLALKNGKVDAAEINTQTLATATGAGTFNPSDYRRIWTSAPIPNDPITVRPDADPAFKKAVKDAFLTLDPADIAKVGAFLDVTPPGPMIAVSKDDYQPLFDLAKTMNLTEKNL
ncbi:MULTISPECIES: phosphate/phosphite/phosphonate ABC transporter substrate-binding protein [Arthrobacter]|uniref:Phosphate/phosphite/phosphonate ABC transporter substrate-binding protein n=1 Tax=Arthrobacter terricola TaxID=2547396 RepID=A0A4R5KIG5_9MICC|nr:MULTISPECIES: phosphate/phosphite/phosphonate ABC transporter substrate-binding protein [Arthrobacter]MBT8161585.1 phosphate/phosphite/phosphonate ABC transporter substrate-binding protein [Arthrobacter sp. GN70]TDF95253.1 phosphate/phosphite/phosphonate ABC transporter substrate-binding protein [Arthrobacter terricola]